MAAAGAEGRPGSRRDSGSGEDSLDTLLSRLPLTPAPSPRKEDHEPVEDGAPAAADQQTDHLHGGAAALVHRDGHALQGSLCHRLLLNHLLESWDSTTRKVRKSLQETVRSFKVTNEELAVKGPNSLQDLAACHATCKNLLHKMKGRGFPWVRLLLVILVFAAGFLVHDIRTQGSFQASSAHILRSSGILSVSQQAWNKVSRYSLEGYSSRPGFQTSCCTLLNASRSCYSSSCSAACCQRWNP
ncbi:transmembrane protein 214-A-like [Chrysemys picta bellii]|uniref:transmembrane protein 214-A-like n=1 Tax=Chrysemys picta bellii TaxID=8478 RepID=UPI0032B1B8AD